MINPESVPSTSTFEAHGLFDVTLDLPQFQYHPTSTSVVPLSASYEAHTDFLSGAALLTSTEELPLLVKGIIKKYPVRFSFCPRDDSSALANFRRQAQLLVLDTLPTSSHDVRLSRRYGRIAEVIAWWEDDHGLWLLTNADTTQWLSLVEWWSKAMMDKESPDTILHSKTSPSSAKSESPFSFEERQSKSLLLWGKACEVLLRVVHCLTVCKSSVRLKNTKVLYRPSMTGLSPSSRVDPRTSPFVQISRQLRLHASPRYRLLTGSTSRRVCLELFSNHQRCSHAILWILQ